MRMTIPCRASTCTHLQCFDASTFLLMNEKKPTWICPVCDKPAPFDKLIIDGYAKQAMHCPTFNNTLTMLYSSLTAPVSKYCAHQASR